MDVIVLKFGSSVLRTEADLPNVVHEIYRWMRNEYRVIAVVSAVGETTDRLLSHARALSPEAFATAELLATGERASAALLGLALDRSGIPARVLNPREIGLTVAGLPLDSELVRVDVEKLRELFEEFPVLVIPGFFGTDQHGRTHCLGRGGSDLTAVFLARAIGGRCRLVKDVDGVYECDPSDTRGARPRRFLWLYYADALRVAGSLVQPKAIAFLHEYSMEAEVAAAASSYESRIHAGPSGLAPAMRQQPLKVLLLGMGTVGFGTYQRLLANPEFFECVGALVRNREKHLELGVPAALLHTDMEQVIGLRPDVVVDALPGAEPSRELVLQLLQNGASAVSANKALIADHGAELAATARDGGAALRYSAAVGGAAPMIEAIRGSVARGPLREFAAVLNGTCNFVLDRCAGRASLEEAILDAQRQGFAERDPSEDLCGIDAARKLRLLARHAFDAELERVEAAPLDERIAREAYEMSLRGQRLRQVARAWRVGGQIVGAVKFEQFGSDHPFGALSGEWNALELPTPIGGKEYTIGRGAGRWPTTESIMADLFDLYRQERAPAAGPSKRI
jgi:homoserine dehydrogenase